MKKIFPVVLVFSLFGCMQQSESGLIKFQDAWQLSSVSIELDAMSLDFYENGWNHFQNDSGFYYVAYNRKTHALDWFDLENQKLFHHTQLEQQGPNQIVDMIYGLHVHSLDSVFLLDGAYLYIIDIQGNVKNRIRNSFPAESGTLTMVPESNSMLAYNPEKKSIISHAFTPASNQVTFIELNLQTQEVILHPTAISDCYSTMAKMRYGVNVSFKGDSIIYNPSCCSDFFVYEVSGKKTYRFKGETSLSKNMVSDPVNDHPDARWSHFIENPKFFPMVYSPADRRYYRLHWKEYDCPQDSDMNHAVYEKPVILSVFDENFKMIHESELSSRQYMMGFLVPTPRGMMLNANNPLNPIYDVDKMELHLWEGVE